MAVVPRLSVTVRRLRSMNGVPVPSSLVTVLSPCLQMPHKVPCWGWSSASQSRLNR